MRYILLFLFLSNSLVAQEVLSILKSNPRENKSVFLKNKSSLSLPFFDDFSSPNISSNLWIGNSTLINNNYPINKIVTAIENELNVKINSIKMNYEPIDKMKAWKRSDWADSWKGSLPLDLNDSKGNLIDFSDQDIEDLKAQLALNNFSKLFDNNEINNLNFETQDIQSSIQDIQSTNISNL